MANRIALPSIRRLGWAGSILVGSCGGLSVANHLLSIWTRTPPQQVLILLCFTVLFSLVAYGFVFRFARRRLASFSPRTRAVWVLLCFLIGAILLVVVPVEPQLPGTRHHLQIVATGDTNPRSQASEVWILEIQRPDGSTLSLDDLALSGDWKVRDGALLSYQNQPASAQWTGVTTEGDFAVTFVSHPWSGVVEVQLDGNQQRLDLYAASGTQIPLALPATSGAGRGVAWILLAAAAYGADLVTLAGLVLVASLWSANRLSWAGSILVGVGAGLSVANHLLSIWARTTAQQILILLCLTALFSLVAYRLIFEFAKCRLASLSPRTRAVWVLICFLLGAILLLVVPVEPPLPPTQHHLQIVATGDRNPRSQASEVWILEIQRPDGSILSLDDLALSGDWEVRDGALLSYQNQPASAQWTGLTTEGDFAVTFVSHPWSGVVEVQLDGNQQRLDLYAATDTQIPVALPATYGAGRGLDRVILPAALYGADLVTLAGLVLVASVWVVTRGRAHEVAPQLSRWSWVYYALPCASVWTLWLLIFWPGLMSPDSIDQWGQMLSGSLDDWHPAFHTMTNWLITRVWLSPAAVAFAQILALSSVVGWGLSRLRRLGAPRAALWASCTLFALSPVNGTMVITLWKDIPYSIAMLALTVLVLAMVSSECAWLESRTRWTLLGGVAALAALYRHNGPAAGFGTVLLLIAVYRQQWRPLLGALALAAGLWLGVRGPLYAGLGITKAWPWSEVAHIVQRNPPKLLQRIIWTSTFIWRVREPVGSSVAGPPLWISADGDLTTMSPADVASQLGLGPSSVLPGLASPVAAAVLGSQRPGTSWLIWRPALYLYIAVAAAVVMSIRLSDWKYLLTAVPVVLHSAALAVVIPYPEVRFQYPVYLVGLLMIAGFLCKRVGAEEERR